MDWMEFEFRDNFAYTVAMLINIGKNNIYIYIIITMQFSKLKDLVITNIIITAIPH